MAQLTIILCDPDGVPIPGIEPLIAASPSSCNEIHYRCVTQREYTVFRLTGRLPAGATTRADPADNPSRDDAA